MKKIYITLSIILLITIMILIIKYCYNNFYIASIPEVTDVILDDKNNVNIKYKIDGNSLRNNIYYIFKDNNIIPDINDKDWVLSNKNEISFNLNKKINYAYLKNEDNYIFKIYNFSELGMITYFKTNKDKIYLAVNDSYSPTLVYDGVGYLDRKITWKSENEKIATVSDGGTIKGISNGQTKVTAKIMNKELSIDVIVSKLITLKPKKYNYNKLYLKCGLYSKKDNDLLDEILKDRIETVGLKTRAGAVEAARFLTLEFPYRITYFSENGRGATNGVDGEGRYYHKGLYLHSSRYSQIGKKMHGPEAWGCKMYSNPAHGYRRNGFDCSGFISWVLYNGGFDVKDVGAGLASGLDLTDYGKRTKFTKDLIINKKVKVGDLLSSGGPGGGHIAIIAGEDAKNYYVAESLWTSPNVGVVMAQYSKEQIYKTYYYVMLMDSYYKQDGKLTKMWY